MKVLIVGNGGREHAIVDALKRSKKEVNIYAIMSAKNPGIINQSKAYKLVDLNNFIAMKEFIEEHRPNFAFIGPEAPLVDGIADFLKELNVPCIGPTKKLSELEASKSFTRHILEKYKIPGQPKYKIFSNHEGLKEYLEELGKVVVKPDGLTGGKGVKVMGDHFKTLDDAYNYCDELFSKKEKVIIEEKLIGEEFSLQSFVSGEAVVDCPVVQDNKRAYEDDKGPNTGGMGSYSCEDHKLPFLTEEDIKDAHEITVKVASALKEEFNEPYMGIMFGGFIKTKKGVKLIEYNARFGDPEATNVLPLLKTDLINVCQAMINGTLKNINIEFENKATVCKYAVPEGYPTSPLKGEAIDISKVGSNAKIFYAAVDEKTEGLIMTGSRAIAFVGIGESVSEAEGIAEFAISHAKGKIFHRNDIGTRRLIERRVIKMKKLLLEDA